MKKDTPGELQALTPMQHVEAHGIRVPDGKTAFLTPEETANQLSAQVTKMGQYILQMGQIMNAMQLRLDDLEARQTQVTIRHADVKRLNQMIRARAEEICGKYNLTDPDSRRIFRGAIKKDVLKRYGVTDLHDIPDAALPGTGSLIAGWVNIRLTMERRAHV